MRRLTTFLVLGLALGGCEHHGDTRIDKAKVEAALQRYSQLVSNMDYAGVAALFAPDGELANPSQPPVHGRDAIRKFMEGFSDFHVLSNADTAASTLIDGNTAEQLGTYHQSVRSPQGHLFEVSGRIEVEWEKDPSGDWYILQLETFPQK
jgi:uncharacterized protein (TIGR02246 family)